MLTERIIRDAGPGAKTRILWDTQVKGFGVRITPAGAKSYVLNYRVGGRSKRATLGRVSELALKAARERAGAELAAIRAGESDPVERRRRAREAPTVNDGLDRFFDEFVPGRIAMGRLKDSTVREYRHQAEQPIRPALGKLRIENVTRRDIERMVRQLPPVQRNRVLAFTSRVFTVFEGWQLCERNPVRGVERSREEPRDRTLSGSEIAAIASALEAEAASSPAAVAAIRIATITGLRIGEVLTMRWEDVDSEGCRLILPETKTGRRVQQLSTAALESILSLPAINEYVFTTGRSHVHYATVRGVFKRATRRAGVADVRLHDLRRTVMTRAAAAGITAHILRDFLGHRTTAMADRYIRNAGTAVAEATERMGEEMAALMTGQTTADVVPIDRRRG